MDSKIMEMRAHIARVGALMFERHLTDAGGGNISARVGDVVCLSPRYSGQQYQWQLKPEDVLVVDLKGNKLEGAGDMSRETKVHLKLHNEYGDAGTAVIHAHARNILVFCAMARPMPMVLEGTLKFGELPVVGYAPAHSQDLADNIANALRGQEDRIRKHAAAALAPWHGLFLMGKDLNAAFDAVERIDTNAYCILMSQLFCLPDALEEQRETLAAAVASFAK
jgi:L-fuculose-phosphate aldolase